MRLLVFGRDREEAEDMVCCSERMSGEEKDRCRETSQVVGAMRRRGGENEDSALCKELSDSPLAPGDARSFNHPIFVKE